MQSWHKLRGRQRLHRCSVFPSAHDYMKWAVAWKPLLQPCPGNMTESHSASPGCQIKTLTKAALSLRILWSVENVPGTLMQTWLFTCKKYCRGDISCKSMTWPEARSASAAAELDVDTMCNPDKVLYWEVVALLTVSMLFCRCIVRGLYVSWEYLEPHSLECPSCWESPLLTLWATSLSKQTITTSPLDSMVLSWHHISSSKACLPT